MREDAKDMRVALPDGAAVIMQWPETISTEDLEMIEQVLVIQLRSVRHAIERRKAANQMQLELPNQKGQDSANNGAQGEKND